MNATHLTRKVSECPINSYNYGDDLFCANVCHCGDTELEINIYVSDTLFMSYNIVNANCGKCLLFHEIPRESSLVHCKHYN